MKNRLFFLLFSVSILGACGSDPVENNQAEPDASNTDGYDVDGGTDAGNDLADNGVEEVNCGSFETEEACREASGDAEVCSVLFARLYQSELQCYGESEYVGCGAGGNHLNTETMARNPDGTCAIFPSTTLPSNGEWTEDDNCNDILTESGLCE